MSKLLSVAVICTLAAAPLSPVWAASCTSLNIKGFSEGDVVYRDRPDGSWKEVTSITRVASLAESLRGTTRFYYVAKGKPNQPGILVIKTARAPKLATNGNSTANGSKSVRLERKRYEEAQGKAGCIARGRDAFKGDVIGTTYDGYHDYGFETGEGLDQVKKFHIRYVNRDRKCDATDNPRDAGWWLLGTSRPSNRSQFSFDKTRVSSGLYHKLSGVIPSAYAATNLYDRRVIMEPYKITDDGTACLPFHLKVLPDSILRIVDLESRQGDGSRLPERER
ncbi:MAG: hypothetical protein ABL936_02770 [Aestuariivirga sp.]